MYEKDNVSSPDLSTVVTKVPIISGQAVGSLTQKRIVSLHSGPGRCWSTHYRYFALLLTFNHKRT
ncbi:protein of unknown function [Caballeronia sp. S22]